MTQAREMHASSPGPGDTLTFRLAKKVYNRLIRPRISWRKLGEFNGIVARGPKLFDFTDRKPYNKSATHHGLEQYAEPGDRVTVVGGGFGVSAVKAAQETDPDGRVTVYEGAEEHVPLIEETAELNGVEDRIAVENNVVGVANHVYGSWSEGDVVHPSELPECDVLLLDCEGAEKEILREMDILPRVCLVEAHPMYGASEALVERLLTEKGYMIALTEQQHPYESGGNTLLTGVRPDA